MELQSNSLAEERSDSERSRPAARLANKYVAPRASAELTLDLEPCDRLRRAADADLVPLEYLLLAAYAALLFRLSGQEIVTVTSVTSLTEPGGRDAVTFDFGAQATLQKALAGMKKAALRTDLPIQFYSGESPGIWPSLDPVLALQVCGISGERPVQLPNQVSAREALEFDAGLAFTLSSYASVGLGSTLKTRLRYLKHLLEAAAQDAAVPVGRLELFDGVSLERIYAQLNRTAISYRRDKSVPCRFVEQAIAAPGSVAVISGDQRLTYGELDQQSDQLAARLVAMGAAPDRPVAICLERSVQMSVALMAVLKSGSCYVPLDPQHPRERLAGILADCSPIAVISEDRLAHLVSGAGFPLIQVMVIPVEVPENDGGAAIDHSSGPGPEMSNGGHNMAPTAEDLAYIIFTSGTTGRPKGVAITHGSLTNLLEAMETTPGMNASDRLLAVATLSFDMAVVDMFLPLVTGATLIIADRSTASDPSAILRLMREHDVTCMQATPTTWKMLVQSGWAGKRDLKRKLKILCGGEALPRDLADQLAELSGELWNCYGPTETTVWSAFLQLSGPGGIVPVGGPIANTTFYVMDEAGNPLPPGVPGELYIGGAGVAREYFKLPELTARRFVPDRNSPEAGARLFRTGDLVRLLEDGINEDGNNGKDLNEDGINADGIIAGGGLDRGKLEFLGRIDHQVKLRGYRIELGEIESVLRGHPAVADAVVLLRNDPGHEPRLIAYFTAAHFTGARFTAASGIDLAAPLNFADLREHCAQLLPAYMMPAMFARLDHLPLTSSGKVDRNALPIPETLPNIQELQRPVPLGVPARDTVETRLLVIFRDILRLQSFGVTDNFFDYGGYSLLAVELFSGINKALNQSLPISLLFDAPTVRGLAEVVTSGIPPATVVPIRVPATSVKPGTGPPPGNGLQPGNVLQPGTAGAQGSQPPLLIIHSYLLYAALPQIVDADSPIYGIREGTHDRTLHSVEQRAALYVDEILKLSSSSPFHLAGWCAAASLTVEVARELQVRGHSVGMLALLDAERPGFDLHAAGAQGSLRSRLGSSFAFHRQRMVLLPAGEESGYIAGMVLRHLDSMLESFFNRHIKSILWLERRFRRFLPRMLFDNNWANSAAVQDYRGKPYNGRITLFRAADVPRLPVSDETLGWGDVARDGVDVVFVPGDHESMFRKPHLDTFGQKLRAAMDVKRPTLARL